MTKILVVDDSEVDRALVKGILAHQPGFRIESAANGQEALTHMEHSLPDVVLSDLIMPGLDGLEVVAAVRKRYPRVPVIIMTAYGNESLAVSALEQGAASYVPKARQAELLVETVHRVIARTLADRTQDRLMNCLVKLECSFLLENDPALIAPLVNMMQRTMAGMSLSDTTGRIRIGMAVEEALLNAMYHGNLEITAEELADARANLMDGYLTRIIDERRAKPPFRDRKIIVGAQITTSGARFLIRDEGPGFDASQILGLAGVDRFERGRNRGLTLMRSFMDQVTYNDTGNQVILFKQSEPAQRPSEALV
jgi:CheY-like chemotaxis protein/anti-sigma regulatory factor (Ser/Thr protein kinase)